MEPEVPVEGGGVSSRRVWSFSVNTFAGWAMGSCFGFAIGLAGGIFASGCAKGRPVRPAHETVQGVRSLGKLHDRMGAPEVFAFDPRPDTQCFAVAMEDAVAVGLWCGEREE